MIEIPPRRDVPGVSYDVAVTKSLIVNRMVHEVAHAFLWCAYLALDDRIAEDQDLRFEWGPKPRARMVGIVSTQRRGRTMLYPGAPRDLSNRVGFYTLTCETARRSLQAQQYAPLRRDTDFGVRIASAHSEGISTHRGFRDCYQALFLTALLQLAGNVDDLRPEAQDRWIIDSTTITHLAIRAYAATQTTTVG